MYHFVGLKDRSYFVQSFLWNEHTITVLVLDNRKHGMSTEQKAQTYSSSFYMYTARNITRNRRIIEYQYRKKHVLCYLQMHSSFPMTSFACWFLFQIVRHVIQKQKADYLRRNKQFLFMLFYRLWFIQNGRTFLLFCRHVLSEKVRGKKETNNNRRNEMAIVVSACQDHFSTLVVYDVGGRRAYRHALV